MDTNDTARQALMAALAAQLPGIPECDLPRFAASLLVAGEYAAPAVDGDIPAGTLIPGHHCSAQLYPRVERGYTVYVPQQYDAQRPAALMVFQDGARYLGQEANAARILDMLIASGDMPVTIALFAEPGEQGPGLPIYGGTDNRSLEYDAQGDLYARFLLEELLPHATAGYNITNDPGQRAIAGISSGGACAFNAAWERPDQFGKVMSHCGSFVNIRGADACAGRVRREAARPLRVYLQSGEHDLDIVFGNWLLANRTLASALAYQGYDHCLVVGQGGHSLEHGGAVLAEGLRWLWRT